MTFEEYYKNLGFDKYPFGAFTTEAETEISNEIYLPPSNYSVILEGLKNTSSIISGERGSGKTALSSNLSLKLKNKENLLVRIEEFSGLEKNYSTEDLYRYLIEKTSASFFIEKIKTPYSLWSLNKDQRLDLSLFLHHYLGATTRRKLIEEIYILQNNLFRRILIGSFNFIRHPLNYIINFFTKTAKDILSSHFPSLPENTQSTYEYFQKIHSEVDTDFTHDHKEYFYLEKLCSLIKTSGYKKIYIVIDKVDEDSRFENDAENIADFIRKIVSDNKILTADFLHILFFTWSTPFNYVKESVRTQKISYYPLKWDNNQLVEALNKRLSTFSSGRINDYKSIFSENLDISIMLDMCNKNPRDLWHILNKSFEEQFNINPSVKIGMQALLNAIERFVKEFNYYEYYPKKSNARSNTMDVYKYIKHLSKLDDYKFTKDKLNQLAGTGGSTNNYVIAMENMGLIKNTNEKGQGGGVIYEICDPKIKYAMKNNLIIE